MTIYTVLFSALLSRLIVLACGLMWVTSFITYFFFKYPPKWCTYSAGMALAWPHETAAISASSVYTIQPCTMSLHAKPHTGHLCTVAMTSASPMSCHLHSDLTSVLSQSPWFSALSCHCHLELVMYLTFSLHHPWPSLSFDFPCHYYPVIITSI